MEASSLLKARGPCPSETPTWILSSVFPDLCRSHSLESGKVMGHNELWAFSEELDVHPSFKLYTQSCLKLVEFLLGSR